MKRSKVIGFNAQKMKEQMMAIVVEEQNSRLVEYAKNKIREIGEKILATPYGMDRSGNLLDSLCWFVSYKGKLVDSGFYREQTATRDSYLHELYPTDIREMFPVYGHGLAEQFINRWYGKYQNGWYVGFAILAPYWGYWEQGHYNVLTHQMERFAIMAEIYDTAKQELKPADVKFFKSKPTNDFSRMLKMKKNMDESPYKENRHYNSWPSLNNKYKK